MDPIIADARQSPWTPHTITEALNTQGLACDEATLTRELARVSLPKWASYWAALRDPHNPRRFLPGATFATVITLQHLDSHLRAAALQELLRVEVMLRARIGTTLGRRGPWAHHHLKNFDSAAATVVHTYANGTTQTQLDQWLGTLNSQLNQSHDADDYPFDLDTPDGPPIWEAVELVSWTTLGRLFNMMTSGDKNSIAQPLGLNGHELNTWIRALAKLRNGAAHNLRFYNNTFPFPPATPHGPDWERLHPHLTTAFGLLSLVQHLVIKGNLSSGRALPTVLAQWEEKTKTEPLIGIEGLGAPAWWRDHPLWAKG